MSDQNQILEADQSVLGYMLRERIGVGGYGEVWSAEAPGGMLKAVKFIFGFHDEKRAQRELKALDRIKHIRHPFLLSLERIDIVDGRMVVITELADMCLKMRFNQAVESGLDGIEREELLSHMGESADALDYIANSHSLAHLDIKPENILLVGGHAKVADFGLVKDLQAVNQSLMDGLTPAYAAPELFDGQPGHASDQYSLAIMYQELLTGARPFSGSTAAQLANQHLHSRPNLNALPRGDQAVVARALSKQPEKRFPDCRSFVEELGKRKNRVRRKSTNNGSASRLNQISTQDVTQAGIDIKMQKPDMTLTISESFVPAIKYEADVEKLPPLELDESQTKVRPTLIIGVGNTGAKILGDYRKRLSARFGEPDTMPAIRLLAIDVDRRSLFEATMGEDIGSLRSSETLAIPLRKPEEYRKDDDLDVSWIGRRWIYNIPKSLLTESLRPLGRLAYVDHHETIYQKISDELTKAAAVENLATTADTTRLLPSEDAPQVIFVGSIAGGLSSGMLLDLAFSTRVCMAELGYSSDHLFGLLSHSTSRSAGDHRLAIANSYSFLNEMYHFNLNGYPGNEPCNVPEFDDQTPVFDGTYLVHFGDDLKPDEYANGISGMAEYLFLSTVTRSKGFFDQCRDTDEFEAGLLKTMGIGFICQGQNDLSDEASDGLSQKLLDSWLDLPDSDLSRVKPIADSLFNSSLLAEKPLNELVLKLFQEQLGEQPLRHVLNHVNVATRESLGNIPELIKRVDHALGSLLGEPGPDTNSSERITRKQNPSVCDVLDSRIPVIAQKVNQQLAERVFCLIDDPANRMHGAKAVVDTLYERLEIQESEYKQLQSKNSEMYQSVVQRLLVAMDGSSRQAPITGSLPFDYVQQMVQYRVQELIEVFKRKIIRGTRYQLSETVGKVGAQRQTLELLRNQLGLPVDVNDMYQQKLSNEDKSLHQLLVDYATNQSLQYVSELEQRLETNVLKPEGGLRDILAENGNRSRLLPMYIKRESQILVSQRLQELRLDSMIVESNLPADTFAAWINHLVKPVKPLLYKCGGTARLLIAVPQNAPVATMASYVQNLMDFDANIIPSTFGDFVVCLEMDQMPADHVAMTLLQMQPDCAELIERLHVRNDIGWSSLTPMC